ncbi:MAG: hypothetical protein MZV65_30865 [Chromatiales bacterium]|nr:hypothetical protein [Chromatiales bacterium]
MRGRHHHIEFSRLRLRMKFPEAGRGAHLHRPVQFALQVIAQRRVVGEQHPCAQRRHDTDAQGRGPGLRHR